MPRRRYAILTGLLILLASCRDSVAPFEDPALEANLRSYFAELLAGHHRAAVDWMDPRFVPSPQAKAEAIARLEASASSFVYHSITNGPAFAPFRGSNSLHCFVPYVADAELRGKRGVLESHLLATRYDRSTNWFFIGIGNQSRETLANYYEHLPQELPRASAVPTR